MPQPPSYTPTTDFSQQEASNASGRSAVSTAAIDTELANIEATLDQTLSNLTLLQRDDGRLKDLACELHTLSPEVLNLIGGFNLRGLWLPATAYAINDIVSNSEYTYYCQAAHVSGGGFDAQYWIQFGFSGGADAAQAAAAAQVSANDAGASATASAASAASAIAAAAAATTQSGSSASSATTSTTQAGNAAASATNAANSATVAQTAAANLPNASAAGADKFLQSNPTGTGWDYKTAAQTRASLGLSASSGSSLVGFLPDGTGADTTDVQTSLRRHFIDGDAWVSPSYSGAANVTRWGLLVAYINTLPGGAEVRLSRGTFPFNAAIALAKKMIVVGEGRLSTIFQFSHTGDGVQSTWPINSSTGVWIGLRDLGIINTNGANAGGGFVDVGGSYVDLKNVYVGGWKYGAALDQTEIATIEESEIVQPSYGTAGIWIVNGADHTALASAGFTNRITITKTQFNAAAGAGPNIVNDGGGAHSIRDNNFNAGTYALRAAGVGSLVFEGNECEGHVTGTVLLTDTTAGIGSIGAAYVGPCLSPVIDVNNISDIVASHILIDDCQGGSICKNTFAQATSANIVLNGGANSKASGVVIEGNSKLVRGSFRQAAPFVTGFTVATQRIVLRQSAVTYVAAALSSGTVTCTPATIEGIAPGMRLWCANQDGTNSEQVIVTAVTSTTFTAVFASSKSANFVVYGTAPSNQLLGTLWTPGIFGSAPVGGATMSVQQGTYEVRGTKASLNAQVVWSALTGGAAGQLSINLPVAPRVTMILPCFLNGAVGAGIVNAGLYLTAGSTTAGFVWANSGTGALSSVPIAASGTIFINGSYDI